MNTTPLRSILTFRGILSGLCDAMSRQVSTWDDQSFSLIHHHQDSLRIMESIAFHAIMVSVALSVHNVNDKIRPWKQFSRTERIVKAIVIFVICILAKNVDSAR